jgi:alkylation response protein AidB-like acyl-CoA dehydrogenase
LRSASTPLPLRHRDFTVFISMHPQEKEVDPQALAHDREEKFNVPLFRRLGELGLLGVTVPGNMLSVCR